MNAEIVNDTLSAMLTQLAAREDVKTVLEVGSGDGSGSTQALIAGLKGKADARLGCLEIRQARFYSLVTMLELKRRESETFPQTKPLRYSSVPVETWMTHAQVRDFYQSRVTALNRYTIEEVLTWLDGEIDRAKYLHQNGIQTIKTEWNVPDFDLVLLDGCPFCGTEDLKAVQGSKIIVLDDILCVKNFENFEDLSRPNGSYQLDHVDRELRNGWAVFVRK